MPSGDGLSGDTPIRWTALLVGAMLCAFIQVAAAYIYLVLYSNRIASDYLAPAALFLFFLLVGGINSLLATVRRSWAFSTQELIVIYVMMTVASVVPSEGFVGNLLPMMTGVYYYATPENGWADTIHPCVPDWLVVSDPDAVKCFYEGSPVRGSIPWDVWIPPLLAWVSFILAVYWVMMCMMSIMRKQWVEHERLVFPLAQLPLEMVRQEGGSVVRPFFKNRMMWFGFAIPFVILNFSGLHHYFPSVPPISMWTETYLFRRAIAFRFFFSFLVTGLAYFLELEIAFSLWFFHVFSLVESGLFSLVGFSLKGGYNEVLVEGSSPAVSVQGIGAMAVLVVYGAWSARGHLKAVFAKAFTKRSDLDDSEELLSSRTAVFGMIGGLIFVSLWLRWSGMSFLVIPLFLGLAFVIFLALTRVIAEGGVGFARTQMPPQSFLVNSVGTTFMESRTLTSLTYTFSWAANSRVTVMAMVINGLKLGGAVKLRLKALLVPTVLALVVGLASSIWITLKLAYTHGGINLEGWFFTWQSQAVFNFLSDKVTNPVGLDVTLGRCIFTGIGAGFMWLLMFLRHHFVWWPLHYLGYPIGDTWIMSWIWFGVFLGWLLKSTILRYGGPRLYVRMRPFFLGLILGHLSVMGLWGIVDTIADSPGNYIRVGAP